jgi:hypothetical protein
MFVAADAVTVKELSTVEVGSVELLGLPRLVDSVVIIKVLTRSSKRSSLRALTILSSVSLMTTSPE